MPIKLTKKRLSILELLKHTPGTLSAAAIHSLLPEIDLVTIYRNLDLFSKEKLIKKVNLGNEEAQYEYQNEPHHHAVCDDCHKIVHFTASDEKLKKLLELKDFKIENIEVTVRGTCNHKK